LAIARKRGVDFVGKTNLTELAVSVSGINTYFGTPHNPLNHRRRLIPGGSSSGSAVAVADDEADVAFGTDTAGSIRVPAACCGVYGLKTTFGLVSLDGVYPIAPTTLDTVGPMAKDLPRLVIGMDLLHEGFAEQYRRVVADHPTAKALRVGRLYLHGTDPKVDAAIDSALQKAGFEIVPLPDAFRDAWVQAQRDALTVATSSAWVHDQSFAGQPGVRPRADATVFLGLLNFRFGADKDALQREHAWKTVLNGVLKRVDFIALPTVQSLPYHIPLFGGTIAFEARVMGWQNTEAVNYAGNPAIAVPVPIQSKLVPLTSLQLIGRPLGEADLCNAARLVDSAVRPDIRPSGQERNQ
jgi:Asp-tRNA(Asn)/Glu-tRNA(Gln) amidotransferase A subunit family amidase